MRATIVRVLAILTVGAGATSSPAAPPASDLELTLAVRSALAAEPELAGLNLLVSVRDRVALVGGPVPSKSASARIEGALKALPGLAGVKVSCWVATADDPVAKLVADRMKLPAVPPLAVPGPAVAPPLPEISAALPLSDRRPAAVVTVQRIAPSGGFLLDPIAATGEALPMLPMPVAVVAAYPTIPPPGVPTTPGGDPFAALKASNGRFAGLTATPTGGTVVISGRAAKDADAWAFAELVRKMPGVTRVVVSQSR